MLKELLNKDVTIHMGILSSFTDQFKGTILEIGDNWIKVKTKRATEYVNTDKIARIILRDA